MISAKKTLLIGSGLLVLSAILTVVLPAIGYSFWDRAADQSLLIVSELVLTFIGAVVPPLGASLIAAGILLFQLDRNKSDATD